MRKTKTILSVLLTAAMLLTMFTAVPFSASAANTWDPANGNYNISTEADLFAFRDALNNGQNFNGLEVKLLNDIEISEGTDYVSPNDNQAIFSGTFNGNNKTISNLNMVSSDDESTSLFSTLKNAKINCLTLNDVKIENGLVLNSAFAALTFDDVEITDCHLTGDSLINGEAGFVICGGIVANAAGSNLKISNCTVADTVTVGDNSTNCYRVSGGLVGFVSGTSTTVLDSTNSANIIGNYTVGGIVSMIQNKREAPGNLIIEGCINYGNLVANESGYQCAAGIISSAEDYSVVYIDRCANHGDITVNGNYSSTSSGGIAGDVFCCSIQNTYNTGKVEAKIKINTIGGLLGHCRVNSDTAAPDGSQFNYYPGDYYCAVINCYNTGDVIGGATEDVGGLCGYVQDIYTKPKKSIIKNSYNFGTVSGTGCVGTVSAGLQDSRLQDVYGIDDTEIRTIKFASIHDANASDIDSFVSNVGYFDTPDVTGTVYPATANIEIANNSDQPIVESVSSTPLSGNLLKLLNDKVIEYNDELEANGESFRYLTWKMTKPASEDGSKGVTVHPMFGVEVLQTLKFHVNEPNAADKLFRVYNGDASKAEDTTEYTFKDGGVEEFYDIPSFAEDDYVFAGWYYNSTDGTSDGDTAFKFDSEIPANVTDVYAHWISVGTVDKDGNDDKVLPSAMNNTYSGFGLFGVQIRPEAQFDQNMGEYYYGGLRFISSVSESLLSDIDNLSTKKVGSNNVEYGYVTAAKSTIDTVADNADMHIDKSKYKIQYKGKNVNGVDTLLDTASSDERKTPNNFRYVTNVDCTSQVGEYGNNPRVKIDHKNFSGYRLMTFVVNYTGENAESDKGKDVVARAYIRYYDANGLLRTFYNDYGGTNVYGGCSTSFNTVNNAITGDIKTEVKK